MTPFAALLGGGAGGFAGAAAAHVVVSMADRLGHAELWLKGPYGPPFFNVSLFMGIMYAGIAFGLSQKLGLRRSAETSLLGFLGPFLGIAFPMAVLSRTAEWGWGRFDVATASAAWYYAVVILFVLAVWGTIFALGFRLGGERGMRGGLGAVAGAFAGYVLLSALLWALPAISRWAWPVKSLLPQPTVLLDGLLTGSGMGIGLSLAAGLARSKQELP